ncbi:hypothetical protein [Antrihabitans cavernicola]|uniref:Uncharacterized protein n=1 Tax=Antrihabitans cavernicola TaxID=2495913 RepID=A0A5A7SAW9_9NOCA|nr:hypothetical protein [Spelaeibacter cavernicola]KAA0021675.1 hypothetical protein FOY51_17450 [Spelaeibacter cavernicola]
MQFAETIPTEFTYYGWNIDLHTIGPFVKGSRTREAALEGLRRVARELDELGSVHRVRLFESTFIPPLPNKPQFDVVLLIDSEGSVRDDFESARSRHDVPKPEFVAAARNAARFGDTDDTDGPVLLNHFVGEASPQVATEAWKEISQWYESVLKVTNSTLLEFEPGTPFVIANYVVVPGTVLRFMANQVLRPSFYRNVTARLTISGLQAKPLFAQRVAYSESTAGTR